MRRRMKAMCRQYVQTGPRKDCWSYFPFMNVLYKLKEWLFHMNNCLFSTRCHYFKQVKALTLTLNHT